MKSNQGGYLLRQGPTCYSIRVPFLLLTEFESILTSCEDNKGLPQTFTISAAQQELQEGQVSKQVISTFQNGQLSINIHSFFWPSILLASGLFQWFLFWLFTKETNPSLSGYNDSSAIFSKDFFLLQRSWLTKPEKVKHSVSKTLFPLFVNLLHSV